MDTRVTKPTLTLPRKPDTKETNIPTPPQLPKDKPLDLADLFVREASRENVECEFVFNDGTSLIGAPVRFSHYSIEVRADTGACILQKHGIRLMRRVAKAAN